ncbi:hypothetical protein A2899_00740 [Candidatus Amesbacteria bacterium RIFCSPLOWO2_01_FULL_49_25]|uniref:Uncharacterized protein n=1 Tax=Candidatus Amesbacteria bacterium RIFCSPHIGHO2_01_FULL_48_32b TaxID=1797253 RepID=A0A1F4YCQ6_9BACT|nr:MAG: hypothetical protein A2876_01505 [Candidatus Amesbacteria bacterium RIFCSPHIGHO2_01_FULL_48_32b]OGD08034.1 MAG: hypothetical protein A2899_00740 [Candidatus Amesbacteria bacterium RIFCSPLOWO2_01_FULL_49_25]
MALPPDYELSLMYGGEGDFCAPAASENRKRLVDWELIRGALALPLLLVPAALTVMELAAEAAKESVDKFITNKHA